MLASVIMLVVLVPLVYLGLLNAFFSPPESRFYSGFQDRTFQTWFGDLIWVDKNFTEGWTMLWQSGQTNESAGFLAEEGVGDLYATFNGYNPFQVEAPFGVSGIEFQKLVGSINTELYPYLVVMLRADSSDSALAVSFRVEDSEGVWHPMARFHTVTSWSTLKFDLRKIYNGNITHVSIKLSNEFDPYYDEGVQHVYIEQVAICKEPPQWILACNAPINANISSQDGILKLCGSGSLSANTIVTSQSFNELTFDLSKYKYLEVSISTSSINVAARIVIWTDSTQSYTVLLKTYNDREWHTEIIDLSFFGISSNKLYMIELGLMQVYNLLDSNSVASYKELSFNSLEIS
jgi:hypothetical protein